MKGKEKRKKSSGRKERSIRGGGCIAGAQGVRGRRNNKLQCTFTAERDRKRELMGGGMEGAGGERNASLKWDNKCARHERTEHTLILRELLYLCTHTYTWGMSKRE